MQLSLLLLLLLLRARGIPGDLMDRVPLSATAPNLDEEERYSAHMPDHFRCDACRVVAYQLMLMGRCVLVEASRHRRQTFHFSVFYPLPFPRKWILPLASCQPASQMGQHLADAEAKLHSLDSGGRRVLSESVYTDVLDRSCSQTWKDYGVREVNQVNRLMGPGLNEGPEPRISVMVTGGPWPTRLSRTCLHYLGEFGEDQIYEAHRKGQGSLETLLCEGPRGACLEETLEEREEL